MPKNQPKNKTMREALGIYLTSIHYDSHLKHKKKKRLEV